MSKRTVQLLVVIAVIIGLGILLNLVIKVRTAEKNPESNQQVSQSESDELQTQKLIPNQKPKHIADDPRITRLDDGRVLYNLSLESSRQLRQSDDPAIDLIIIEQLLEHYRYVYKGNPIGENFEIVEQLMGKNPMKIVFIEPQSEALEENVLIDNWDTPYFFHALSGQDMEIRSAGPDRTMWTADDVLIHKTSSTPR